MKDTLYFHVTEYTFLVPRGNRMPSRRILLLLTLCGNRSIKLMISPVRHFPMTMMTTKMTTTIRCWHRLIWEWMKMMIHIMKNAVILTAIQNMLIRQVLYAQYPYKLEVWCLSTIITVLSGTLFSLEVIFGVLAFALHLCTVKSLLRVLR